MTGYKVLIYNKYSLLVLHGVGDWHETPEEGQRTYQLKCCDYNNKDEVNSLNILSNNNYQASSQKFKQIIQNC